MHLHFTFTLAALVPLAFTLTSEATHSTSLTTLVPRAPINLIPLPPSPKNPYFLVTGFEAFLSSPAHPDMHSRAAFNLTLMHPDMSARWSTLCMAHTSDALCNKAEYIPCEKVAGARNANERLSFRFGDDVGSVEIMRSWKYQNMHLKTMAREDANWNESVNGGNVTVSEFGKYFERPEGWVFAWRQTVG